MLDPSEFTETNHPSLYYQHMLADELRMRRYRKAITEAVRPGDVVADLGTGLGVLAIMAVQAGAKLAYGIDARARSLWIAERVLCANGVSDQVKLIEGNVREVQLEEPVDLIVNELIGNYGTDEGMFDSVREFARRNLKSEGRILPARLRTYLVPVEYRGEFRGVWRRNNAGLDLRAAIDMPCKPQVVRYGVRRKPKELAPALLVEDHTFAADMADPPAAIEHRFDIEKTGTLQGFVGYFDATLVEGIELTNYPCYATCHWENWNWPISPPIAVKPGQAIALHLKANCKAPMDSWIPAWELVSN